MTGIGTNNQRIPLNEKKRGRALLGALTLAAFLLILCSTDVAIEYMKKGLGLCAATVIPSLFPFMVISELIVSSGVAVRASRLLARPMRAIFSVSEAGAAVYILGALCGFPIAAKTAASMYDKGIIEKAELERLLTFTNNAGSAFVISAVGVSLLGNKGLGILLYVCVIISSIIIGFFGKLISRERPPRSRAVVISNELSIKTVTGAVQSSALSMLSVCAYVVFFSAFVGCIGAILAKFRLPDEIIACIFGFFELSSGVGAAAALGGAGDVVGDIGTISGNLSAAVGSIGSETGVISAAVGSIGSETGVIAAAVGSVIMRPVLCALFLGWSGLSVHFQIMSVCSGRDVSFKKYLIAKGLQGVICAALVLISLTFFFPSLLETSSDTFAPSTQNPPSFGRYFCLALFISSAIFAIFSSRKTRHS